MNIAMNEGTPKHSKRTNQHRDETEKTTMSEGTSKKFKKTNQPREEIEEEPTKQDVGASLTEFLRYLNLRDEKNEERRQADEAARRQEDHAREEKRRQEEVAREERFQQMMMTMLQFQTEGHQKKLHELEEARHKEHEEQQQLERERLRKEEERLRIEQQLHAEQMALQKEKFELEHKIQANMEKARLEEVLRTQQLKERELRIREVPQMAQMKESEDIELYLSEFEQRMADLQIPQERWMLNLRPLLAGWVKEIVEIIPRESRSDYNLVKKNMMDAYNLQKGTIGHRLVSLSRDRGMSFTQWFLTGMRMWRRWTEDCDIETAGDQLLMEMMYQRMPTACSTYCRDKNPKAGRELCAMADKYFMDRDSNPDEPRWYIRKTFGPKQNQQNGEDKMNNLPFTTNPSASENSLPATNPTTQISKNSRWKKDSDWEKKAECYLCKERGHISYNCPNKTNQVSNIQLINKLPFV